MTNKIQENIKAHDSIAGQYEDRHGEIFNEIEQNRLYKQLKLAKKLIKSKGENALDFGCGSGNLTAHLINLGLDVTASDVSPKFLKIVKKRFNNVKTSQLNGQDLSQFDDNTFDMIATYSVLHHIPDYLSAVKELIRVLKQGGILYIDHEVNDNYWNQSDEYKNFVKRNPQPFPWHKLMYPINWYNKLRRIINPRFQPEGDIHVFPDDHIEWEKINNVVENNKAKVLEEKDYLLYKSHYNKQDYEQNKNRISDMRFMIVQKN